MIPPPPGDATAPGASGPRRTTGRGLRARIGLPLGPLAAIAVWLSVELPGPGAARAVAAVATLMIVWWVTEPVPLAVTALLPVVLLPLTGAGSIAATTAAYGDPLVFLFLGGFLLAFAMQRWELHRRVALLTLRAVGTDARRVVGGFMLATAFLSMWVSNTATTVMMLPVALSILGTVAGRGDEPAPRLAVALTLGIAYAASIGSLATLIGTPTNAFLAAYVATTYGIDVGFGRWLAFALPLALSLLAIAWWLLTRVLYRPEVGVLLGGRAAIDTELRSLGPLGRGERNVLAVLVAMVGLWVLRQPLQAIPAVASSPFGAVDDATVAIAGAVLLFVLPVDRRRGVFTLDWSATRELPWSVLILFGGALALAGAITSTGLDVAIGTRLSFLGEVPSVVLVLAVAGLVLLVTELMSNTAALAAIAPVLSGLGASIGVDPMILLVPATLASTCAFALPVATPPNAIVFGSGRVTVLQMLRAGLVLNLVAVALITVHAWLFTPIAFPAVG